MSPLEHLEQSRPDRYSCWTKAVVIGMHRGGNSPAGMGLHDSSLIRQRPRSGVTPDVSFYAKHTISSIPSHGS
ncbi:hypothetical protein SNOG_09762 [Parastagonospora nodorum SN15]|uniref:Uncharacterized protein n=1 Tax=Phaeosphaeria nodorum (strain SN15 / ATCC MYA-4574 / FGSC 10173) TaxID=321614 RepID=Q0UEQ2_PHANO|nr:hypothetical protein SNOG_09762 [Parastagonospora nodorum SN15]EAT83027.1 hypothetical protein SNOG_09762 [Parastagonospora nodorum SN15]